MNTDKNKNTDDMKKALTFIFGCILAVSCVMMVIAQAIGYV